MRVAIHTRSLRPPLTGIGHFVYRLIDAMLPMLSPDERLLSFNGWWLEQLDRDFLARVQTRTFRGAAADKAIVVLRQISLVREGARALQAGLLHRVAERNFDVFHAVNYVPPGAFHKPVLPIIYDLSHMRYPQTHPKDRVEWLEQQLKLVADVPFVQTISEFSKSEIVTLLGMPADRIYVTYPAPGAVFRPERETDDSCLARYGVEPLKYFLVVGTREPRKNVRTAAEAYTALPAALLAEYPLLWIGPSGWGDLALSPAVERAKELGRIRIVGYVQDRDLAALYRNTMLFVMPSLYEGFGMPVVEAMACGARMALSRIPVFEEIAGADARYVDPMDVEGWRTAMNNAVEGRYEPPCDDRSRLARFSWSSSAASTLDLYRRLA
jgi:glycosyltransferase involved in cell wall biosynthesis